jgi:hypothetical protein
MSSGPKHAAMAHFVAVDNTIETRDHVTCEYQNVVDFLSHPSKKPAPSLDKAHAKCWKQARETFHDIFDRSDFCDSDDGDFHKHIDELYRDFSFSLYAMAGWELSLRAHRAACCQASKHKHQKECIRSWLGEDVAKAIGH